MTKGSRLRWGAIGFALVLGSLGATGARAGDDGQAPIWTGIGSIFGGIWGFGGTDEKPTIDYREHGKIVVPPKMDLPAPGAAPTADASQWPVNQEVIRKKAEKDAAKKTIAGVGDARLRYTHPFDPNGVVTVHATDHDNPGASCADGKCGSTTLGSLNPLNWVGMGKTVPLGPEPDRQWLTDPPKGFRAPVEPVAGSNAN